MNNLPNIKWGISISASQNETPEERDFMLGHELLQIIEKNEPANALHMIISNPIKFAEIQTPLADIGFNQSAIVNLIKNLYNDKKYEEGIELVKSLAQIVVFGFDNPSVFEKYINLLKLFNFKLLRFSLNWNKIISTNRQPNYYEINNYKCICIRLKKEGIEPIVTFSHFETMGLNPHSKEFKFIFDRVSSAVLNELIPAGVKYWLAFNEPAVHSAGINFGFWGSGKMNISGLINHFKTLDRIGFLGKDFYEKAHNIAERNAKEIKVIANFNVSRFDGGISPTFIDEFLIWLGDKIDKDAQLNPYRTNKDHRLERSIRRKVLKLIEDFVVGTYLYNQADIPEEDLEIESLIKEPDADEFAFDLVALNPYQIYNFALTNRLIRNRLSNYLESGTLDKYIPSTSNPDFKDPNETRVGYHGQLLHPKSISSTVRKMSDDYGLPEIVMTEVGADIHPDNIEDKVWYLEKVKKELEVLVGEGIPIPFALVWTLVGTHEILGPPGGGADWYFGIIGEPLKEEIIKGYLITYLKKDELEAATIAQKITEKGNTPLRVYDGMPENLGRIFGDTNINYKQLLKALLPIMDGENDVVNILQIIQLREYYEKNGDNASIDFLKQIEQALVQDYLFENNRVEVEELVEA